MYCTYTVCTHTWLAGVDSKCSCGEVASLGMGMGAGLANAELMLRTKFLVHAHTCMMKLMPKKHPVKSNKYMYSVPYNTKYAKNR